MRNGIKENTNAKRNQDRSPKDFEGACYSHEQKQLEILV
jgi:hypothetical protein